MEEFREHQSETPILDGFLSNFHLRDDRTPMRISFFDEPRQRIKEELDAKAQAGTLTKSDIESALQRIDIARYCAGNDQARTLVVYLARNYRELFIQITGHNPFES